VKTYLVEKSHNLLELVSGEDLRLGLQQGRWSVQTRIYDEETNEWTALSQHPDWRAQEKKPQPLAAVRAKPPTLRWIKEWYYLVGLAPIGPVTYPEMLQHLQSKRISVQSQVWRPGIADWTPLGMLPDFHPATIKRIFTENWNQLQPMFQPRRHHRIPFQAEFVVHNRHQVWPVISYELGAGGLGIMAGHTGFELGQEFFLQQTSASNGPSIHSRVQIVSKSTNGLRPGMARYGLEFIDISRRDQEELQQFTDSVRRA